MIKSVYVHIPFCRNICSYCDFCKNYYNEDYVSNYLDNLLKEIKKNYKDEKLSTLYIGGGTPSSLSFDNLIKLFKILKKFKLVNNYEFTFECNYEDITEWFLLFLKNNGVNRISIGIETFNEKYSKILERKINKKNMIESIILTKKYFDNINIDLMYALPNQMIFDLKEDLKIIKDLNVNHISTYSLIIEDHTKISINGEKELDEEVQENMYYEIVSFFKKIGYVHYELSNFSKSKYESKHNLTYWNNEEYYGFGAGASGFVNNIRYDNTKSIINYNKGKTKTYEEKVSKSQLIKDEVMLAFRKTTGIDKRKFYQKFNVSFEEVFDYKKMISNNLLVETTSNIFIPEDKLFVSNEIIIMLLDLYNLNI